MKNLVVSPKLKTLSYTGIAVGLVCLAVTFGIDPKRAWNSYVMNYYFFMSLGMAGLFFTGTQHLTSAGWSATVRRIPESLYSLLPASVILFLPILIGGKSVYGWMNPQAIAADHVLAMKTGYLNVPFFVVRAVVFFGLVWFLIGGRMVKNSLRQDTEGGVALTQKNTKLSAIFMPFYALFFSFISFDLIMSLDPHWYSTMFGVNAFANMFLSGIALILIIVVNLKRAGYFGESVNENHIQNLGLLLFAFTVFYAYIAFCQFMLIWYGNLPEETSYFLRRWENGWSVVAMTIVFLKFVIPFLLLLPRESKRNQDFVVKIAWLVLVASWIDTFWMVMPTYSEHPFVPFLEAGTFLFFAGILALCVSRFLSRNPVQPLKDPRMHEALHLHQ